MSKSRCRKNKKAQRNNKIVEKRENKIPEKNTKIEHKKDADQTKDDENVEIPRYFSNKEKYTDGPFEGYIKQNTQPTKEEKNNDNNKKKILENPIEKFKKQLLIDFDKEHRKETLDKILGTLKYRDETAMEHIKKRHFNKSEKDLVMETLRTGRNQGVFTSEDLKREMSDEELYNAIAETIIENVDYIANEFVSNKKIFDMKISAQLCYNVGYGLNDRFELVNTNTIELALMENYYRDAPYYFKIQTCYNKCLYNKEDIIKTLEQLKEEYKISDCDIERYEQKRKRLQEHISNKEELREQGEMKAKIRFRLYKEYKNYSNQFKEISHSQTTQADSSDPR